MLPPTPHTEVLFTVVSQLAEGADRLIARELLAYAGTTLEAALPLQPDDYENDFKTDASRAEFREFLERSVSTIVMTATRTREEAYEQAGRRIVERSDVVIALWDGEPARGQGGTAQIVEYARVRGVPLVWIQTAGEHALVVEADGKIADRPLSQVEEYNASKIGAGKLDAHVSSHGRELVHLGTGPSGTTLPLPVLAAWVLPYFGRADTLARRFHAWYLRVGNATFILAAAAVAAAAAQILFFPDRRELVWVEVGILISLLLMVFAGRRFRFHERWLAYRFLAERFRSAFFLALTAQGRRDGDLTHLDLGHESEEWLRRAFSEVWAQRPHVEADSLDVAELREFLTPAWITDQLDYYRHAGQQNRRRHERLSWATNLLFAATIVVAVMHASPLGGGHAEARFSGGNILELLTISLPAIAGAIGGIRSQREYLRNSERFDQMAHYLGQFRSQMTAAKDLQAIQAIAAETEDLLLEESRDWFVVMKFHDFELHV
jgi:hypothetical protein